MKKFARLCKGLLSLSLVLAILMCCFTAGGNTVEIKEKLSEKFFDNPELRAEVMGHVQEEAQSNYFSATKSVSKTKYIAEIVSSCAETFTGTTQDDYSRPTNSYLPKGTVDYCNKTKITDPKTGKKYYLLNYGSRVYAKSSVVKIYKGTLPQNNTVTYSKTALTDKKLKFSFNLHYRAPFKVKLGKQSYANTWVQDYNISSASYTYLDITFPYTKDFKGEIDLPKNNLFKKVKVTKNPNKSEVKIRLYLKEKGAFFGWDSYYDTSGQLVFSFLLPAQIQKDDSSPYGYSLKGVKILIDPGHGGSDPGAFGLSADKNFTEQRYALLYAKELSEQLRELGATVTFTRTSNKTVSLSKRFNIIRNAEADLCISIHFNANEKKIGQGYFTSYFHPFSKAAASFMSEGIAETKSIKKYGGGIDWHYFRLSRVSACPVVLTENGFLDNKKDYSKIRTKAFCETYITGMTKGIVDYFKSIRI